MSCFRAAFFCVVLAMSQVSLSQTKNSEWVNSVASRVIPSSTVSPIFVVDKDDLDWRFLQAQAFGSSKAKQDLRAQILTSLIEKSTGVHLTYAQSVNLETYALALKDSAVAFPVADQWGGPYKLCVVFPADASSRADLERDRILGLSVKEAYGTITAEQILPSMTYEEFRELSLLHELGHCLDSTYMPQAFAAQEDPFSTHRSEMFGEVFAVLAAAKNGNFDLAPRRAQLRLIYSQIFGRYLATHPEIGFGNPLSVYGGSIYFLSPALLLAQDVIRQRGAELQTMTTEDLLKLAKETVQKSDPGSLFFQAMHSGLAEGEAETLRLYQEREQQAPDLFFGFVERLQKHFEWIHQQLSLVIAQEPEESRESRAPRGSWTDQELCALVGTGSQREFFKALDFLRTDLQNNSYARQDAIQLQRTIRELPEKLANGHCSHRLRGR